MATSQGSLRERKKEQTRVEIIRAAVELFRERGYDATTIEDIAERANYSQSTFFRYFGTKDDVVFGNAPQRLLSIAETITATPSHDPCDVVRRFFTEQVLDLVTLETELEPACVRLWFTEPALLRRYTELLLQFEPLVTEYLASARGDDPATSIECQVMAAALVGVARKALALQLTDRDELLAALNRGFDSLGFSRRIKRSR